MDTKNAIRVALSKEPEMNEELKHTLSLVNEKSECDVVLDFSKAGVITSASLSLLLKLKTLQKESGQRLLLCKVPKVTRKILVATGIDGLFEFADDKAS